MRQIWVKDIFWRIKRYDVGHGNYFEKIKLSGIVKLFYYPFSVACFFFNFIHFV